MILFPTPWIFCAVMQGYSRPDEFSIFICITVPAAMTAAIISTNVIPDQTAAFR